MEKRAFSIDALRGFAIITMILSGQMVLTHLPAWMAHAQVPPGSGFNPNIFGITWVDLVFPFFLFAMGAAFPFSIGSKIAKGENKIKLVFKSFFRGLKLVFFAIFFQHAKPFIIDNPATKSASLIALFAFVLLFLMFADLPLSSIKNAKTKRITSTIIQLFAFIVGFGLIYMLKYEGKNTTLFDIYFSDIIIIVLANMAFFGAVIYIFTFKKPLYRLLLLPFVMAVFLSSSTNGWVKSLYEFTPAPWAYSFYFLKYLFIVIPGSIAGEFLYEWKNSKNVNLATNITKKALAALLVAIAIIIVNVSLLFSRQLELNLLLSVALIAINYQLFRASSTDFELLWKKLSYTASYLLLLGLFLEAYQGGIRKDDSTYSYYFVTSGLAFFAVVVFSVIYDYFKTKENNSFLILTGQNPMIAYVATALVIMPLITIFSLDQYFTIFNQNAFLGLSRGLLFTLLSIVLTVCFSKMKWFWRT